MQARSLVAPAPPVPSRTPLVTSRALSVTTSMVSITTLLVLPCAVSAVMLSMPPARRTVHLGLSLRLSSSQGVVADLLSVLLDSTQGQSATDTPGICGDCGMLLYSSRCVLLLC